jgi:hypothetical protein
VKYIPIGDKIELNLGADPNVMLELIKLRVSRNNIWMQGRRADVFVRADQPGVKVEPAFRVVGWDEHEIYAQAGKKLDLLYEIVGQQGHNAKQGNVTVEEGVVTP